jgi:AsmA protein
MRKRKILLIVLLTFLLIVIFILFIPSLFKSQVSEILKKEINQNISGTVTFSDSDVNLWRHFPQFTVTLEDFVLAGKNEFKGDTLVSMKEFHLVFGSFQLLFKNEFEIKELKLYDPAIHVIVLKNGRANYNIFGNDSISSESENSKGVSTDIESFTIENGKFRYQDRDLQINSSGEGVSIDGTGMLAGNNFEMNLKGEISNFNADKQKENYIRNKKISLDLDGVYNLAEQSMLFTDTWINVNHLEMALNGKYAYHDGDHLFDLSFHSGDTDFKDLLSLNDSYFKNNFDGVKIKGHVALEGHLKGFYRPEKNITPAFKIDFKVNNGSIKYDALSSSINSIFFDLVAENKDSLIENTNLDLKTFKMNFGDNPLNGFLQLHGLKNSTIKSEILAKINLADFQKIYPIEGITMDGSLQLDVKANGTYNGFFDELKKGIEHKKIPAFDLSLTIKDGILKYNHLPEAISDINFHLKAKNKSGYFDSTLLKIEKLEAKLGDNPIKGYIHINGFRNPIIDSDLKASLDLADIKNFYPIEDISLKGLFNLEMKVNGELNPELKKFPMIDSRINLTNAYIKSDPYPFPMENTHLILEAINTTGKLKDTRINIDTLTYSIANETFLIEGTITDLEKYTYNLAAKGIIYLDKIGKIFNIAEELKLGGEVDIDLKTAGNYIDLQAKAYHRLPTSGRVTLKNIDIRNELIPEGLKIKEGHFIFSNEKIILDTLHGSLGSSQFNLTGHINNYPAWLFHSNEKIKGDLQFESDTMNVNELLHEKSIGYTDTVHHDLVAFKVPENVDFRFDAKVKTIIYKDIAINNFDGEITIKDGVLSLAESGFKSFDGSFTIKGDYDTRNMDHPLFDIALKIDELDISKAHTAFVTVQIIAPAAEDTYGVFSLDYALKGELHHNLYPVFESVEGGGTIRIREAKINGMKIFSHISGLTKKEELKNPDLKDVVMETVVDKGIIYIKPFSMKIAGFDTDIEGKHDINGSMNYILKMAIPPFEIVKIPLHVNGTYDNPKIHLGKGHEETLKKITQAAN